VDANRAAWLGAPYPNPGRSLSTLRFGLPKSAAVSLRVFDAAGRLVRELENGVLPAGEYTSTWDLRGTRGDRVPAGVYFVRMALGAQVITRSVTVTP
jgi:flagellar hook assembly protein FlgD